ncbi:MAG: putative porin [Bacteroidales bacterium]|nr:putative porin [Bacteroidales bacterium]
MKRELIYITLLSVSLNAFAQEGKIPEKADSVTHSTRQYKLDNAYTEINYVPLDTVVDTFHRHEKTEDISPFFQGLGNYGLPYMEIDFFDRPVDPEYFIYRNLRYFMHHAGNKLYIDTQVPFTELKWTFGGERQLAEQTLGIRHAQNVNPFFNIGLDLDVIYSLGQYIYQKSDNRAFTLHASYLGNKYKAFASWSLNNLKAYENGGIADPQVLDQYETRDVPVNLGGLNEAISRIKNMNFQVIQKYTVGGGKKNTISDSTQNEKKAGLSGTFSHILEYEKGRRIYEDNAPGIGFYDTVFISQSSTYDSLYARVLKNTLRFDFNTGEKAKFQLGIGIGAVNEQNIFAQIVPTHEEEIPADSVSWKESSNALLGTLFNRIGEKFGWRADGKLYFTGLRAGDFELKGNISKRFNEGEKRSELVARGSVLNTGPAWWMNSWGSNHYEWSNDFSSEFRINVGGSFHYPAVKLGAGIDYALITNMFYFSKEAIPEQHDGVISVLSARLNKNFSFWKLRFDNSILFQKSSNNDILHLPLLCARSAFYFNYEFYFRITGGRLQTQLGFEAEYNTAYNSYSYMPATGIFYVQNEIKTGNYPVLNVFANIKLKRTRIFVGVDHVNYGLMGYDYFISPYYPMNIRTFKYGIAWTFYN